MAIELNLTKSPGALWGFRMVGGQEFGVPLIISKVDEGGVAEAAGLQVHDMVVRMNDESMVGATHQQADDFIRSVGNHLVLGVRREDISHLFQQPNLDESRAEEEVSDFLQAENMKNTQMLQETVIDYSAEIIETTQQQQFQVSTRNDKVETEKTEERKWSTFLQKPKNPAPPIKKIEQPIIAQPYRVIIKKQKKKTEEEKSKIEDTTIVSEEVEASQEELPAEDLEQDQCLNEENNNEENNNVQDDDETTQLDDYSAEEQTGNDADEEPDNTQEEENKDVEEPTEPETANGDSLNAEMHSILEEKILEIQKQLHALATLPSTIQSTIEVLSQQLADITRTKVVVSQAKHENEDNSEENANIEDEVVSTNDAEEILEEQVLEEEDDGADKAIDTEEGEVENTWQDNENATQEEAEVEEETVEEVAEPPREKVNLWDEMWPWCDEKKNIYRINFLKYEPPVKNLDYLQRSEVYKLIHDMEPKVRGICNRSAKILAEQDYYEEA